jgi:hypothetical protein
MIQVKRGEFLHIVIGSSFGTALMEMMLLLLLLNPSNFLGLLRLQLLGTYVVCIDGVHNWREDGFRFLGFRM